MKKHVHLGLLILELSKILMHEFWYCYEKPNYGEKEKFFCSDTDSFIAYIKASYICKDIAEDLKPDLILQVMSWIDHCIKEEIKR